MFTSEQTEPGWLPEAVTACSFDSFSGQYTMPDLEEARDILESAGIPCHLKTTRLDEAESGPQAKFLYELLVPGGLILHATSVLDKEFFNPRQEAEWRTHFETMSDKDFRAIRIEDLTAGMLDRVERLKRAYTDERARRIGQH